MERAAENGRIQSEIKIIKLMAVCQHFGTEIIYPEWGSMVVELDPDGLDVLIEIHEGREGLVGRRF